MTTFGREGHTYEVPDPASVEELSIFLTEYAERQFHSVLRLASCSEGSSTERSGASRSAHAFWEKGSNRAMASMASRFSRLATEGWLVVILRPSPRSSTASSCHGTSTRPYCSARTRCPTPRHCTSTAPKLSAFFLAAYGSHQPETAYGRALSASVRGQRRLRVTKLIGS